MNLKVYVINLLKMLLEINISFFYEHEQKDKIKRFQ